MLHFNQTHILTREFVIFGGKGSGVTTADYLAARDDNTGVVGLLNDYETPGDRIAGYQVLGKFQSWRTLPEHVVFCAPLHLVKEMQSRSAIIDRLAIPKTRWGRAIHPRVSISPSAEIGYGCSIGPFCDICPSAMIGAHVALRFGVLVSHDTVVEDFAFLGSQALCLGYTRIGKGAHIGPNSVIKERVKIGEFAVVGMGSTVLEDVEPYSIVVGSPARKVGEIERLTL